MSIRKAALIGAMTIGLAGAGSTAAFAGETPTPTPSQQTVTPTPSPSHHHHVRSALWQFDFTGANIDGLQLNDVRGVGPIPMSRWTETDNSPTRSTFTSPSGTSSVTLRHNRLPLPVINLGTCTATFDQIGTFRIVNGTGTGAGFRVVPGTSEFILRGIISFDQFNLRHHRTSVCPLVFVNPWTLRQRVENNDLTLLGQLASLVDFDVQGNAQLARVITLPVPTPTPTNPHFFAPNVSPNPDNQPDTPTASPTNS
jgi:hypothetical protein